MTFYVTPLGEPVPDENPWPGLSGTLQRLTEIQLRRSMEIREGRLLAALASLLLRGRWELPPCPHLFPRIGVRIVGACLVCGAEQ